MDFTKMQGAGNDFIIIDNIKEKIPLERFPALARRLCTRRLSVGADGLMALVPPRGGGDCAMLFFNSDGSLGEMCGNGARCLARFCHEAGYAGEEQRIETTAGLVTGRRLSKEIYRVRLNDPGVVELGLSVPALGREYDCAYVELGSPGIPHAVLILDREQDRESLRPLAQALRSSPRFPKGANVNFVRLLGGERVSVLTYERGVEDFTLACGTGCGSSAVVLSLMGLSSGRKLRAQTAGGELEISLSLQAGQVRDVLLSGPAVLVCHGQLPDDDPPAG